MNLNENISRVKELMGVDPKPISFYKAELNEGLDDTSWEDDEGNNVTLRDLLSITEDIPVIDFPVKDLKSHLLDWGGDSEEMKKVEKADLQYPILIFVNDDGKIISIIDGHHRARKALKLDKKYIKSKLIPLSYLPKDIYKTFKHLDS